jgi:hypothetical protein
MNSGDFFSYFNYGKESLAVLHYQYKPAPCNQLTFQKKIFVYAQKMAGIINPYNWFNNTCP